MNFSDLLRDWMVRSRYNGAEASAALNVSESTVGRWLNGKGMPDIRRVDELAEIMGMPASEIAVAIVSGASSNPMTRVTELLEAVLARLSGVEARQVALEARLDALDPPQS